MRVSLMALSLCTSFLCFLLKYCRDNELPQTAAALAVEMGLNADARLPDATGRTASEKQGSLGSAASSKSGGSGSAGGAAGGGGVLFALFTAWWAKVQQFQHLAQIQSGKSPRTVTKLTTGPAFSAPQSPKKFTGMLHPSNPYENLLLERHESRNHAHKNVGEQTASSVAPVTCAALLRPKSEDTRASGAKGDRHGGGGEFVATNSQDSTATSDTSSKHCSVKEARQGSRIMLVRSHEAQEKVMRRMMKTHQATDFDGIFRGWVGVLA